MTLKNASGWTLVLFAAAALLLVLLAMSLGNLQLSPGYTIPLENEAGTAGAGLEAGSGEIWITIIRGFLALAVLLLPVYVINALTTPQGRRRLAADLILIAMLTLLANIIENQEQPEEMVFPEQEEMAAGDSFEFEMDTFAGQPLPDLPDEAPQWLTGVVITVIAVAAGALGLGLWWYFNKRKAKAPTALDQLADEAQRAIDDIQSGGDLSTAILRSYAEMNRLVRQELGLARDRTMTARDFELFLEGKGLPGAPLRTLTQLFEQARYGGNPPGSGEETRAVACLTEIVQGIRALKTEAA
ncbi:MAG: DUF4129 domain-containing protein [Anaerolineae bacterium]|nr:DUF4129 domain-containing protein [Anaerolineae bacterium]